MMSGQKSDPPAPRSRGLIGKVLALWPGVAVVAGIAAIGFTMRAPAPKVALVPAPIGWTRFSETGANICMAIRGDDVYIGGKTGLWHLSRSTDGSAIRVVLPVDLIHIRSIECTRDGSVWIGHLDGLIQMKESKFVQWSKDDGLPGSRVNCIHEIGGRMMAGTSGGLVELVGGKWTKPAYADQLASKVVNSICEGANGDVWIGSSSDPKGGLNWVHGGKVKVWRAKDGLPHPYIQDIKAMNPNEIWVATGQFDAGGVAVFRVEGGQARMISTIEKSDGLAGAKARSLGKDKDGGGWVGSENDGLAVINGKQIAVWTVKGGLPHNEITSILNDADGNMWLTTLNGAVRIDSSALAEMKQKGKAR